VRLILSRSGKSFFIEPSNSARSASAGSLRAGSVFSFFLFLFQKNQESIEIVLVVALSLVLGVKSSTFAAI
jgi:hypothetical protein